MSKSSASHICQEPELLLKQKSILGDPWVPIYESEVDFDSRHFESAMHNIIKQPNINSTVILRADILKENVYDPEKGDTTFVSKLIGKVPVAEAESPDNGVLTRYLDDMSIRQAELSESDIKFDVKYEIVRRIIPRNPYKDHILNQTCLILSSGNENTKNDSILVVYIPHIKESHEIPFYLPPVYGVGILYHNSKLSIHYMPFGEDVSSLRDLKVAERPIRIALRLLQTSSKHSLGQKQGYEKRVHHDLVVSKIAFQSRYIYLKKKYSSELVNLWCESTDPKKHVFEDLAIAAFLIELWAIKYKSKNDFEFRDLGCGNGLLVHILIQEGYKGKGIDARERKSWATYPKEVQDNLVEQIFIPSILLRPHPSVAKLVPVASDNGRVFRLPNLVKDSTNSAETICYTSSALLNSSQVCTTDDFPPDTFIIGNHSDELTCWIPLLGFPFMVIPCCSHNLSGRKTRFSSHRPHSDTGGFRTNNQTLSTYGALVEHVEYLAKLMGWIVEKEMLRIPSTRNAAIIATEKHSYFKQEPKLSTQTRVLDIIALEGGADGWVESSTALMKNPPRNH